MEEVDRPLNKERDDASIFTGIALLFRARLGAAELASERGDLTDIA